jgi:hypothetical protein
LLKEAASERADDVRLRPLKAARPSAADFKKARRRPSLERCKEQQL